MMIIMNDVLLKKVKNKLHVPVILTFHVGFIVCRITSMVKMYWSALVHCQTTINGMSYTRSSC